MSFFTRLGRALLMAAAVVMAAFAFSCSKKCGDKVYDEKTQFCCNNRDIVDKCGGKEFDPETHFCNESDIVEKCGGKEYDLAAQFCYNNSVVADKCDGKEYDAETKFCLRNEIMDRCGRKEYDPDTQFCDTRDSSVYKFVKIKKQTWMAQNLNYQPTTGKSWCYDDKPDSCEKYGRLYDWGTAKKVCPNGWHLPSDKEWDILSQAAEGKRGFYNQEYYYWTGVGKKLKAKSGWHDHTGQDGSGTDDYGFSALPGGKRYFNGTFLNVGGFGVWWTGTTTGPGYNYAYFRSMNGDDADDLYENVFEMSSGVSVRCVQN